MIYIRHCNNGRIIYKSEAATAKAAVEEAVNNGVDLSKANLSGVDLRDAFLRDASLDGADLTSAKLDRADMMGASLCHADLQGASLTHAELFGSYLEYANLADATLRWANLGQASMVGARLTEADLQHANLSDTAFSPAQGTFCATQIIAGFVNDHTLPVRVAEKVVHEMRFTDMADWHHDCKTRHCIAGWIVHLSGQMGYALEAMTSPSVAAAILCPSLSHLFFSTGKTKFGRARSFCRKILEAQHA